MVKAQLERERLRKVEEERSLRMEQERMSRQQDEKIRKLEDFVIKIDERGKIREKEIEESYQRRLNLL